MFGDAYIVFILLAALASSLVYFQKEKPSRFLFFFPVYLFTTFTVEYIAVRMSYKGINTIALYNIFTAIEFVFYLWMFSQIIHHPVIKKFLYNCLWMYPVVFLMNRLFIQKGEQYHTLTAGLGSLLIVLAAIFYFYELFQSEKSVDLVREPSFWISSGLLFFYSCSFPLYSLISYFYSPSNKIVNYLVSLSSLLNILLYSSFIVAFLCKIRIRKFSS
ncbi:MAG: hypothetical protein KF746_15515 [Chitinophagaceae bacterium]|nr:hypothetical protein [Chitinophagaceae bacterium]